MDPIVDTKLINDIRAFVADQTNYPLIKISQETRLASDLGVDGDDGADLIERFSREFIVDLKVFVFAVYFGPEGSVLFMLPALALSHLVPSYRRRQREKESHEITILHLARCAKAGYWFRPNPETPRPRPQPGLFRMGFIGLMFFVSAAISVGPLLFAIWLAIAGKIGGAVLSLVFFAFVVWSANRLVRYDLQLPPAD